MCPINPERRRGNLSGTRDCRRYRFPFPYRPADPVAAVVAIKRNIHGRM